MNLPYIGEGSAFFNYPCLQFGFYLLPHRFIVEDLAIMHNHLLRGGEKSIAKNKGASDNYFGQFNIFKEFVCESKRNFLLFLICLRFNYIKILFIIFSLFSVPSNFIAKCMGICTYNMKRK